MTYIKGKDVLLYVRVGSEWWLAGCTTTNSLTLTAEEIPITTADSGIEDEYEGGATNAELALSGVGTMDEVTKWQYEDWMDNVGQVKRILYAIEDSVGNYLAYDMNALIRSVSNNADAADFGYFDVSLIRSGAWTKIRTTTEESGIGEMVIGSTFIVD
jgi:hypothetical protein